MYICYAYVICAIAACMCIYIYICDLPLDALPFEVKKLVALRTIHLSPHIHHIQ